jgi:ribosomal protein RSM22 (predicted rRNA methylase)
MQLPLLLRQAIDDIAHATSSAKLQQAAAAVSERYRRIGSSPRAPLAIADETEAQAYAITRLPATYAAAAKALTALREAYPGFAPQRMADMGAGPATVALAALELWPQIEHLTLIEPNHFLRQIGETLLAATAPPTQTSWIAKPAGNHLPPLSCDIVTSGYVLNEIMQEKGADALRQAVLDMWQAAKKAIVLIEPGTPGGQSVILAARQHLIDQGAFIAAPCPHAQACPVAAQFQPDQKWCHFSVRVERSRAHKNIKPDAVLGFEDEKFSYLVAAREKPQLPRYRLIGTPRGKKVIEAETCQHNGQLHAMQSSKSSDDHKALRKADWGDGVW